MIRGEWVLELARALIEAPSPNPPGDERSVAGLLIDALEQRGLPRPQVIAKEPERPNLLTTIDFGPGGRHLCLCGHMDTKPVGAADWSTDPFEGVVDGTRLYGLGSCDMKGALAAMIEAAASTDLGRGRLSLLFTADEENAALFGARFLAESDSLEADSAVIGEPGGIDADWDQLHVLSRGIANLSIRVLGDQGHSSLSDRKPMINASVNMARLLTAFAEGFRPSAPNHPLGATPTVNAGVKVEGGVNFGVHPGEAGFSADVRTIPGMERDVFEAELEGWLQEQCSKIPELRARIEFEPEPRAWLPPTEVAPDAPVATAAAAALEQTFGIVPPLSAFPGTTDAAWIQGLAGIPTLPALGPGLLERAHSRDEFIDLDALAVAADVYALVAKHFCAREEIQ
ncbi:MAG: M20 family metallopeptidase [Actinomycetota bacterium]|nr:M20 family metallopeptidase [Actinomycetota bacterium]